MAARKSVNVVEETEVTGPVESVTVRPIDDKVEIATSVSYKFNVGNFENADVFGSAKAAFAADVDVDAAADYLISIIYRAIKPGVELTQDLCDARKLKSLAHMLNIE